MRAYAIYELGQLSIKFRVKGATTCGCQDVVLGKTFYFQRLRALENYD